jgi:UDP-N-acetylglucosamine diphosphorylase / glucose-1-phosphate thymidylyltransferase / UDP-N-acetylgalactosamine diphosphorylase / glucosamine-1-phosphate N-acetyltransferase / galactosamine-1-phosphate N-acetyltransferase
MAEQSPLLSEYVAAYSSSPLARYALTAWQLTSQSERVVRSLLATVNPAEFLVADEVAVHRTAKVESGAVLKGPLILGSECFVASGAYLRGGCWVSERCTFGPGAELKSSFVFPGTKLAHFNFVGDSILGTEVNLEAGSIVCNYRNERADKEILIRVGSVLQRSGCQKFGAVVGDRVRIGANAVVAPGALLQPSTVVARASLLDQELA